MTTCGGEDRPSPHVPVTHEALASGRVAIPDCHSGARSDQIRSRISVDPEPVLICTLWPSFADCTFKLHFAEIRFTSNLSFLHMQ